MKVTVYRNSSGSTTGFQVSGHSEYARDREDILCAAVSALTTNCINSIETFTKDEPEILAVNEEEGFMHYRLKTLSKESLLLLDSLVLGLQSIEESYSKFIQVQFEEEKSC